MRSRIATVGRGLRLLAHLVWGLLLVLRLRLSPEREEALADRLAQGWLARLLSILAVQLVVRGEPPEAGALVVANHVSWLDIPVLGACVCTRFVAKSEVGHWPIAGAYADAIGTFYLRRGAGGSRPLLARLVPHLAAGGSVVLFPEGTTTDGTRLLPFHPRLFQAALDARCPVQPVGVRYRSAADGSNPAPFVGDDTLLAHVLRLLSRPGLVAEVVFGPLLPVEHYAERQTVAVDAEEAVRRSLGLAAPVARARQTRHGIPTPANRAA